MGRLVHESWWEATAQLSVGWLFFLSLSENPPCILPAAPTFCFVLVLIVTWLAGGPAR